MKKVFNIGLIGCGTVGGGVARLLLEDNANLLARTGIQFNLKYIFTIDVDGAKAQGAPANLITTDYSTLIADSELDCIIELVGGTTFAKDYVEQALKAGKDVITANKALLAKHGKELFALARENGAAIGFEASCAGGIPVIRAIYDGLAANKITALFGIVNGTCNYILTAMIEQGKSYDEVLKEAQAAGLAEADPTLDVNGMDSAHKLTILSSLAFGVSCDLDKIPVSGIDNLSLKDVNFGQELGYTIKLLAVAERTNEGVSLRVRPAFISKDHPLAWVGGAFNAVSIYGNQVGHTMYYGRGAGASPTASAVVADIVSMASGYKEGPFQNFPIWLDQTEAAIQLPQEEINSRYYIRIEVTDKAGVFAKVANILSEEGISITGAIQHELQGSNENRLPIIVTTHPTKEGQIGKALERLNKEPEIFETCFISIVEEHTEFTN